MKTLLSLFILFVVFSCSENKKDDSTPRVHSRSVYIVDEARQRTIPLELYENTEGNREKGMVVLNAGYGCSNTEYTYIARYLAAKNYWVLATHHEQQNDEMLSSGENMYEARLPNWEEGVRNLEAILRFAEKEDPSVGGSKVMLIGHSNGGDIAALFATKYPEKVKALVTLDNRRMPLTRSKQFKTLSIRADEFEADEGVLPTKEEEKTYPIRVVVLKQVGHNFMRDNGTEEMKKTVLSELEKMIE